MAFFRINKTQDYTVMSNTHFKERNMSLKAKGLLSQMLSLPDSWDFSVAGLAAINKESVGVIRSTLDELKKFGYLVVTKKMPNETESGRIEYVYDIYEQPHNQGALNQCEAKQHQEKQGIEKQYLELQYLENDRQLITNKKNTKILSTYELRTKNIYTSEFEKLWSLYPRKQGKEKAKASFVKARQKGVSYEEIEQGLLNYVDYIKYNKVKAEYIKHGSTWFNQCCWSDTYDINRPITTADLVDKYDFSEFR